MQRILQLLICLMVGLAPTTIQAQIRISEIMYHPASDDVREEYIELHNAGPAAVNLSGWQFSRGVRFTIPERSIPAGGFLVVAADVDIFTSVYGSGLPVVGSWEGRLSNNREELELVDATGSRVDRVAYADEGDWGVRRRGPLDHSHRGWLWTADHDGEGKSVERISSRASNNTGQNWASSEPWGGTPGASNSVSRTHIAPLILAVTHLPAVPRSVDPVTISAEVTDDFGSASTAHVHWRLDGDTNFAAEVMYDDGAHDDGVSGDGVYAAMIPPQAADAVVEFYIEAGDDQGFTRTWPAPAVDTDGTPLGQVANALYQVDDAEYAGAQPLIKLIMKDADRAELADIGSGSSHDSDAQMNGTCITVDGTGTEARYTVGVRNRGHGSRNRKPNNYRINFVSDRTWQGVTALNVNGQYTHVQLLGAILSLRSGLVGADARPVQVRVNNANLANNGPQTYGGVYVANEVINSDWADHWFPDDGAGNIYRAIRDDDPPNFDYRGTNWMDYANTYFKQSNAAENDWTDLIAMLEVMGENRTNEFTIARARSVIDLEQWLLHLSIMALFANGESGLNTGNNDDYYMYRGVDDPRFDLMYYDLDQILGQGGSQSTNTTIFRSTCCPVSGDSEGSWRAMKFLLHHPEIEPVYIRTLDHLLATTFAKQGFDATVDQVLGGFVPSAVINSIKHWMDNRRAVVQLEIQPYLEDQPEAPRARVTGSPRSPTPQTTARLTVSGDDVVEFRFRINGGPYGDAIPVDTPIVLSNLVHGSTNQVSVIAAGTNGVWQSLSEATPSAPWVVRTDWPAVRINEVLARNTGAFNHHGTFPDAIELWNEGDIAVTLAGLRLTDNPASPDKFVVPPGINLAPGEYLVLYANNDDGTPGLHTGFSLGKDGEGVYLFDSTPGGRGLLDAVTFGLQLPDLSIGRLGVEGPFILTQPSFGGANLAQPVGDRRGLRINEWLASEVAVANNDFVEVYNGAVLPVALGGCYLTDNPISQPAKSRLAPLSFVAAGEMRAFIADGDPEDGNDHVAFRLAAEQGLIALLDPDLETIDLVSYGPQRTDVSEGRAPDGGTDITFFAVPTPGAPNPVPPVCTVIRDLYDLMAFTNSWRYNQTNNLDGVGWVDPGYDDSNWPAGAGLLYREGSALPAPKSTPLSTGRRTHYFRTTFEMPVDPGGMELTLDVVVDDGAVIHLNGEELERIGMGTGPVVYATPAGRGVGNAVVETLVIPAGNLVVGENTVAVEVHQNSISSSDVVWGMRLSASRSVTNCAGGGVVLNEVVAANQTPGPDGRTPDWVEILNTSTNTIDLGGMSLTDTSTQPDRWVFPTPSLLAPGESLVVECDGGLAAGAANTGFGLDAGGDAIYLYDSPVAGGAMLDSVRFGLQAPDYGIGRSPAATDVWVLTLPTPGTANVAAGLGNAAGIRVNEWMAAPEAGSDWLELYNPMPQPVAMSGLALTDDPSRRDQSPFPSLSFLGPGQTRMVVADNNPHLGADHAAFQLDADGDFVGLYRSTGTQIDAVLTGPQATGVSDGRFPDGSASLRAFPGTDSPGAPNYLPLSDLVINEILTHSDPPWEDAVEIHNRGPSPIDIGGWWLSDRGAQLTKFRVPSNTVIAAGGYQVFYEGEFGTNTSPHALVPFRFDSAHGGEVHLAQADGAGVPSGYRASARFGAAANGVSFGRFLTTVTDEFVAMTAPTFGEDTPASVDEFRTGTGAANPGPRVGPIIISEIHYQPISGPDGDSRSGEFIELQNISGEPVPLFDPAAAANVWQVDGGGAFVFPPGLTLEAGETAVVVAFDPASNPGARHWFRTTYGVDTNVTLFGPLEGDLNNAGEAIALYRPDPPQPASRPDAGFVPQVLVEQVRWLPSAPWPTNLVGAGASLQRRVPAGFGNEPLHWFTAAPSPTRDNLADSDGDSLPDYWEALHGLNPAVTNGVDGVWGDPDGDGLNNQDEYLAGTDPRDSADLLQFRSADWMGSELLLGFHVSAGRAYRVRYRTDPTSGEWKILADAPISANAADVEILDPQFRDSPIRHYQLLVPTPEFP